MISASDADGFYDIITYSLDNDYDGTFVIDQSTGVLMRTSNVSIPAPAPVSGWSNLSVVHSFGCMNWDIRETCHMGTSH